MKEEAFRETLSDLICASEKLHYYRGQAIIQEVKRNKKHPHRLSGRPDIHIYHDNFKMRWRKLSNPFFIECKLGSPAGIAEGLLQMQRYKFAKGNEVGLKKYGDFHVALAIPELTTNPEFNWRAGFAYRLTRILWHMGLGIVTVRGGKLHVSFNELERFDIEGGYKL